MIYHNIMCLLHTLKPLTDLTIYRIYIFPVRYHFFFYCLFSSTTNFKLLFYPLPSMISSAEVCAVHLKIPTLMIIQTAAHTGPYSQAFFSEHFKSPQNNCEQSYA